MGKVNQKDKRLIGDIASYLHRTFANDNQMYSQIKEYRKRYYRDIAKNIVVKVRLNTTYRLVNQEEHQ